MVLSGTEPKVPAPEPNVELLRRYLLALAAFSVAVTLGVAYLFGPADYGGMTVGIMTGVLAFVGCAPLLLMSCYRAPEEYWPSFVEAHLDSIRKELERREMPVHVIYDDLQWEGRTYRYVANCENAEGRRSSEIVLIRFDDEYGMLVTRGSRDGWMVKDI